MVKKILLVILVLLLLLQFYRPAGNISDKPQPQALKNKFAIPANVEQTLQVACYDCHSNNTRYPWYANFQPVNWWLNHHVDEGKEKFNFDEFLNYPPKRQLKKIKEVVEVIEKDEMPLDSYTLIHRDAILSESQKKEIVQWANSIKTELMKQPVQ